MTYGEMFQESITSNGIIAMLILTFLEIVLGIDNIIFISITADRLPKNQQAQARTTGLLLALFIRLGLLLGIGWVTSLTQPLSFSPAWWPITGQDLMLLLGGLFLVYKTWQEIWEKIQGHEHSEDSGKDKKSGLANVILQIMIIDIIFSVDSILAAIPLSKIGGSEVAHGAVASAHEAVKNIEPNLIVMAVAVVISIVIMMLFAGKVSDFINQNPRIKMLALAFLLVISFVLIFEGTQALHPTLHMNNSYIYVALAFALFVESLNLWEKRVARKKHDKKH